MRTPTLLMAIILVHALGGCSWGGWDHTVVESSFGARIALEGGPRQLEGELLMVEDDGVLVLAEGQVIRARWGEIRRLSFRDFPVETVRGWVPPDPAHREQIRLASRYPYGLTEEQLTAVLQVHEQDRPRNLR